MGESNNGYVTREAFRSLKFQRRYKDVQVPGLGKARIQNLNAEENSRLVHHGLVFKGGQAVMDMEKASEMPLMRVAAQLVDSDGERIFGDHEIHLLGEILSAEQLLELHEAAEQFMEQPVPN